MDRVTIGSIGFCVFVVLWAYTLIKTFGYEAIEKQGDDNDHYR